jgi:hypothetical protein
VKQTVDEHGVEWRVFPRDPAQKYILALQKKGYHWIVLPRKTYITGEVPLATPTAATSTDYIRNVRLRDCVKEIV